MATALDQNSRAIMEAAEAICAAESPQDAAEACRAMLGSLAQSFEEASDVCTHAWQDKAAGAPWRKLARICDSAETRFDRFAKAQG